MALLVGLLLIACRFDEDWNFIFACHYWVRNLQCDFHEVWSVELSVVEEEQTARGSQFTLRVE